jgi:hypothetical protein
MYSLTRPCPVDDDRTRLPPAELRAARQSLEELRSELMRRPVKSGAVRLALWWVLRELSDIVELMEGELGPGGRRRAAQRLGRVMVVVKALRKLVETGR